MLIKKFGYYCNCFYIYWAQNEMEIRNSVYLKGKIIFALIAVERAQRASSNIIRI